MVCCGCTLSRKIAAALTQRLQITIPTTGIFTGHFAERFDVIGKVRAQGISHIIGAEGCDNPSRPICIKALVMRERIERALCGRYQFNIETVQQRAGRNASLANCSPI